MYITIKLYILTIKEKNNIKYYILVSIILLFENGGIILRVISGSARGTTLHSIDDINTRPTLDRVKESLFNILQNQIKDTVVLDLFAGSGQVAIEFLSRGATKAYLCDKSTEAIKMIKQNLERTKLLDRAILYNDDFTKTLLKIKNEGQKFDFIYLDPPYKQNLSIEAIKLINSYKLLKEEGAIIIETDEQERDTKELEEINLYKIYDLRKYGRASLIFLK